MTHPASHKTIIVLDHCSFFNGSSNEPIDLDVSRNRGLGTYLTKDICKTMWTCNIEAVLEYSRITYDIFPTDKLIKVLVSGDRAVSLNNWTAKQQSLNHLMEAMAGSNHSVPSADESDTLSAERGLTEAIRSLCELTPKQQELVKTSGASEVENRGIIILITSLQSDTQIQSLEDHVLECLLQNNKKLVNSENMLPIRQCDLVLVDITPVEHTAKVIERPTLNIGPILSSEVHTSSSGQATAASLIQLAIVKYGLASTTITGIPMKEQQNAHSSANYDVELLHSSKAHAEIMKSADIEGLMVPSKEGLYTQAVMLKWLTPKSNVIELHQCNATYRISPVDVTSRPSSCLTTFLLSGRSVMLEQPRKAGTKVLSHMLASHGGEIYLHTLMATRSSLEDPPSISEGCGGRVTDYRISDFGRFMKENRLAPVQQTPEHKTAYLSRSLAQLERMTRCWPLVISESVLFGLQNYVQPLLQLLPLEILTPNEVEICKKCIYDLFEMERMGKPLDINTMTITRGKGPKKDDQYRQLWGDIDRYLRAHSSTSSSHQQVLDYLLTRHATSDSKTNLDTGMSDSQWAKLQKIQPTGAQNKLKSSTSSNKDSPPAKVTRLSNIQPMKNKKPMGTSLLSMLQNSINEDVIKKRVEFDGRRDAESNIAPLYIHLTQDTPSEPMDTTSNVKDRDRSHERKK